MGGNSGYPIGLSDDSDNDDEYQDDNLDEIKGDLLDCLDEIQHYGVVATSKEHAIFANPGLVVADTPIPLPLVPRDAETIRGACRQAPFGKGDETLVDTSVRKTWELDHSQFRCANPRWLPYVDILLREAAEKLGISMLKVEPYKLMLYDEGSLFKRHKDSEKVPGMIGTLVICLPSKHEGGSVHLSHTGKHYVFDTDKASEFYLTSLAWFSDVTHEVKPLKSGYRLVLTYNIIQTRGTPLSAGMIGKQSAELGAVLTRWKSKLPHVDRLILTLEHLYTKQALSLTSLKGRDRAVCQTLYEVGLDCGFTIFLGTMTRTRIRDSDYGYGEETDYTMLEEIKTCDGYTLCRHMSVYDEDLLLTGIEGRDADSEDEAEFTGNESMPSNLRYHDTVVVIVPMNRLHSFIDRPSPRGIMNLIDRIQHDQPENQALQDSLLKILGETLKINYLDGPLLSDVLDMAVRMGSKTLYRKAINASLDTKYQYASAWYEMLKTVARLAKERYLKDPSEKLDWDSWLNDMFTGASSLSLTTLQKILNYLNSLLLEHDLRCLEPSFEEWKVPILVKIVESKRILTMDDFEFLIYLLISRSYDMSWLREQYTPMLSSRATRQLICAILKAVYDEKDTRIFEIAENTFQSILEGSMEQLALRIGDFLHLDDRQTMTHAIKSIPASLVKGFLEVVDHAFDMGLTQQATRLIDASCTNICQSCSGSKTEAFPRYSAVQHFLESLISMLRNDRVPPLDSIKNTFVTLLRNILVAKPPERPKPPQGWAHRPRQCNPSCEDCIELSAFLRSSEDKTREFRMVGKRRQHIEDRLPRDLFHYRQTNRSHLPYGLIVTKLGKEFQLEMREYHQRLSKFEGRVRGLRCEELKLLLGEDMYNELVMLKDIPDSEGAKQLKGAEKKRKAEDDLEGSSSSRPRVAE
ncbi:hypothetical protein F5Y05DRAFT_395929 [Hypoxylon sp. FL0543]|nr:hypothetical protein F5Y05DRAFT_395929 [Hypoxylon sp. FL0543]